MKEWVKDWIGRKKKYRHKLKQNIMRLGLPMESIGLSRTYWSDIIKMSLDECRAELAEVESDIKHLEDGGWDGLDEDEDSGDAPTKQGRKETRND